METQNARSARRSTLRPSQQKRKAALLGKLPIRRKRPRTPSSESGVPCNRIAQHVQSSPSNSASILVPVKRRNLRRAYIITHSRYHGHRRRHGPQCGSTASGPVHLYHFLSFRTPLSGSSFRQPDHWTHYGKEIPRKQDALTYKGIPRWSLITIDIPVLHTHTQLALG